MNPKKWLLAASLALLVAGSVFAFGGGRIDSMASLDRIKPGVTTVQQVRELFGPPAQNLSFPRLGYDAIQYDLRDYGDRYLISISYGSDGIVREVMKLRQSCT